MLRHLNEDVGIGPVRPDAKPGMIALRVDRDQETRPVRAGHFDDDSRVAYGGLAYLRGRTLESFAGSYRFYLQLYRCHEKDPSFVAAHCRPVHPSKGAHEARGDLRAPSRATWLPRDPRRLAYPRSPTPAKRA